MRSLSVESARCHNEAGKVIVAVAEQSCAYCAREAFKQANHSSTTTFHTQRTNLPFPSYLKDQSESLELVLRREK
jgi:hypothetical protein